MLALAQQSNILDFPLQKEAALWASDSPMPIHLALGMAAKQGRPASKSNEWYTPARYIEAARLVMGSIDLDPASCEIANRTVKAKRYYTQAENGLMQPWYGNVWLNPPLMRLHPEKTGSTKSHPVYFIPHLLREYELGHVEQAVVLLLGLACFRVWFEPLWKYLVCFQSEILTFQREDGTTSRYGFGTNFIYLGPNEQKFIEVFSQFGTIAKRVSQPRHTIATPSLWEVTQ